MGQISKHENSFIWIKIQYLILIYMNEKYMKLRDFKMTYVSVHLSYSCCTVSILNSILNYIYIYIYIYILFLKIKKVRLGVLRKISHNR